MGRTSGTGCRGGGAGYSTSNIPRSESRNLEQVEHLMVGADGKPVTVTAPDGFVITKGGEERIVKMPFNSSAARNRDRLKCLTPKTFEDFRRQHEKEKILVTAAAKTAQPKQRA
jgi:hypothetical protein